MRTRPTEDPLPAGPRPRRVCVVTGARSDYGLLYWLLREIEADPDLELRLVATGMHLAPEFGLTIREIEADGFPIVERVEMLLSGDTPSSVAKSVGLGMIGFSDVWNRQRPDWVVLLGDRFETLAAAASAHIARIPVAHIHGGETTEGAVDEAFRHAVTKMAQLHLVAAEPYRRRVIQLGESPERVFTVGSPGLDHLYRTPLLSREELEGDLDFPLTSPLLLVTYHPVTLADDSESAFGEVLAAFDAVPEARIVFTAPNADPEGLALTGMIREYLSCRPRRGRLFASLGQRRYLSLMRCCDAMVGNTSSGLTEAPSFGIPVVNVGDRQKGRLRAASVVDCPEERPAVEAAIRRALTPEFREVARKASNPYGGGGASARIKDLLKGFPLEGILGKTFYDLPE
jgi:UDP-N-acetylglucosamine 2-epimerase (non-hydrolysing)/GDP/UDP-N,N'-diacetylbacillosamine 2-epimerase (hydrolysing)